jgi:hypothetical protein
MCINVSTWPITGSYSEPDAFRPHEHIAFLYIRSRNTLITYTLNNSPPPLSRGIFTLGFLTKILYDLLIYLNVELYTWNGHTWFSF